MKLIKCRNCGKKVSSKAKRCPKCGTQLRLSMGVMFFLIFLIIFIVAVVLVAILS
jgi:hypothetical protein